MENGIMQNGNMENGHLEAAAPAEADEPPIAAKKSIQVVTFAKVDINTPNIAQESPDKPESNICRKNIWGICEKLPSQCRFEHSRNPRVMRQVLKFCHDYQNQGCSRQTCTYIHSTKEEQTAFLRRGAIPPFLSMRYAALEARLKAKFGPNALDPPATAAMETPVFYEDVQVEPTFRPEQPTLHPVQPTLHPVQPPLHPVQPTLLPVQPPLLPVQPPLLPVQPPLLPVHPPLLPVHPPLLPVQPPLHPPLPLDIAQILQPPPPPPTTPPPSPNPSPPLPIDGPQPLPVQQNGSPKNIGANTSTTFSNPGYLISAVPTHTILQECSSVPLPLEPLRGAGQGHLTCPVKNMANFRPVSRPSSKVRQNPPLLLGICSSPLSPEQIPRKRRCLLPSIPVATISHSEFATTPGLRSCMYCLDRKISINNLSMKIDNLLNAEKQYDHVHDIMVDNYKKTKDFILVMMAPEQRIVTEHLIETSYEEIGQNATFSYTITSQTYEEVNSMPSYEFMNNLLETIVSPNYNTSPNTFESSTSLQHVTQVSRMPMQTNKFQEMSHLLQQFIAHCGHTFLLNQITGTDSSNVAHTDGIVNSINNHIEIATSPTVITEHAHDSSDLTFPMITNGPDDSMRPALFVNRPPPYPGYLLETPTTSPATRTPISNGHTSQMYQNVISTQQVGVKIYKNNAPASLQHQTGQKSYNTEQFPSGPAYYNPYNQVVELVLVTLTTQRIIVASIQRLGAMLC